MIQKFKIQSLPGTEKYKIEKQLEKQQDSARYPHRPDSPGGSAQQTRNKKQTQRNSAVPRNKR